MERFRVGGLLLTVLSPLAVAAQTAVPAPAKPTAFSVADIHPSPFRFGGNYYHTAPFNGDRFIAYHATPLDLLTEAYKVEEDAVTGGPAGIAFDRYDIIAKLPPGTIESDTPKMLQSLLTDRFKLIVETKSTPLPAFLLKTGKGPLAMKPAADATSDANCVYQPPNPPPPPNGPFPTTITLKCTNTTMAQFADELRDWGWQYFSHPVVDTTGLKGAWDFDFRFSWQTGGPDTIPIPAAVEKLGLKLETGTAPRPAIVVTSMADAPTPNAPGIEKLLPPLPAPTFQVAVIHPSKSEEKDARVRLNGNQVTIEATELRLISFAWDISTKTVFDGPAYFDNQVWEVTAKLPEPDTTPIPGARPMVDFEDVRLMMRSLLAERFGLKAHTEDRDGMAYTLYPGNPHLKPANPANRSSCTETPAPGEKNPQVDNPYLTQYTHCDNVTIDQFAREFQAHSGYIIKSPVLNRTGIEGRYDITLAFSDIHTLEQLGIVPNAHGWVPPAAGSEGGPGGGDPQGVPVMITDAVAKQTGLKLVLEKRPISVLVVDHIDEKPTDN